MSFLTVKEWGVVLAGVKASATLGEEGGEEEEGIWSIEKARRKWYGRSRHVKRGRLDTNFVELTLIGEDQRELSVELDSPRKCWRYESTTRTRLLTIDNFFLLNIFMFVNHQSA